MKNNVFLFNRLIFVVLLFLLPAKQSYSNSDSSSLLFGIMPDQSPNSVIKNFSPLAGMIEKATGKRVHLVTAPDLYTFLDRVSEGRYDLIFISNRGYLKAEQQGKYHAIAKGVPSTRGAVIVRKDSGIASISQLKGKRVAAAIPESFACYQFLQIRLQEIGLVEDVSFAFLKTIDTIIYSVLNKEYDAGTIKMSFLKNTDFDNVRDKLKIIETSLEIPRMPFAVRNDFDKNIEKELIRTFESINTDDPVGKDILKQLHVQAFRATSDHDYKEFREFLNTRGGIMLDKP